MTDITKPAIIRLARRSGVKSISDDCYDTIRNLIKSKLEEIIESAIVVNSEHQTKTLMAQDIYEALHLLNYNVAQSSELSSSSCSTFK
jgi:histone H4